MDCVTGCPGEDYVILKRSACESDDRPEVLRRRGTRNVRQTSCVYKLAFIAEDVESEITPLDNTWCSPAWYATLSQPMCLLPPRPESSCDEIWKFVVPTKPFIHVFCSINFRRRVEGQTGPSLRSVTVGRGAANFTVPSLPTGEEGEATNFMVPSLPTGEEGEAINFMVPSLPTGEEGEATNFMVPSLPTGEEGEATNFTVPSLPTGEEGEATSFMNTPPSRVVCCASGLLLIWLHLSTEAAVCPLCTCPASYEPICAQRQDNKSLRGFSSRCLLVSPSVLNYSSPMTSLVLTDSSQLTSDSFKKLPDQITYPLRRTR
uniref:Uncharacterized protein n=1 Tax=Timema cristinae TaxID=61476 RepID=A0A7R9D0G9_TIMCR|nr:unnamed protein product [Timema cristinae]